MVDSSSALLSSPDWHVTTILSFVVAIVVISSLVLFVAFLAHVAVRRRKLQHIPGPKRTSIIFGCYGEVRDFLKDGKSKLDLLLKWQSEYGPVFKYSFLHRYIIVGLDPDVVKEMLTKTSVHLKPYTPYGIMGKPLGIRLMGKGLITEDDFDRWKVHRAMLNPSFNRRYLMNMVEAFNDSADHLVQHLMKRADGVQEVRLVDAFNNVTLDIIAKVTFNLDLNVLDDPESPFPDAILTCLNTIMMCITNPWLKYQTSKKDRMLRSDLRAACDLLRRVGRDCIADRLEAKARGDQLPTDMLTNILEASGDLTNKNFGMEEMLDEFVTFFMAGQETTSNLMSFTMEQLGKNPDVLKKVQEELDEKLGSQSFVSFQEMSKLDYLMLVLKESLRMYAPASIVNRVAGCDVTSSSGLVIPKGSQVTLSPFVMGRMPQYFEDPEVFRPERFIDCKHPPHAYFPFGAGSRTCIGQQFALIEARILLAKILRIFTFDLVPGQKWDLAFAVTIRPVDGCKTYVSIRN